jgi:hypothetical protein
MRGGKPPEEAARSIINLTSPPAAPRIHTVAVLREHCMTYPGDVHNRLPLVWAHLKGLILVTADRKLAARARMFGVPVALIRGRRSGVAVNQARRA